MPKILSFLLFTLFTSYAFAQDKISLKGKIQDQIQLPLVDASIIIGNTADSLQIASTYSDENGNFNIDIPIQDKPVYVIIEDPIEGIYKKSFEKLTTPYDFGTVELSIQRYELKEVLLTVDPVVVKNDTIEYNASSYAVKPNANLEALLRELPGVDVDDDGKITVNGKEVNEILIDGEPFFGTDGKVALENIPADIIKKVQVSDFKTRNEKFSGERSRSDKSSINVTLKEDKKQGYMAEATVGYGTDNRYEANLMANYFKGNKKFSLIGSSNDIASTGLSNGAGSFGRGRMGRRGGNGITNSSNIGFNYNDKLNEKLSVGANYNFNHTYNKNENYTRQENLLPDNIYTTESNSLSKSENFAHNFGGTLEWNNNLTKIFFAPKYTHTVNNASTLSDSKSIDENGQLRNESLANNRNESKSDNIGSEITLYQGFKDKSYLNATADLSFAQSKQNNRINSSTVFYNSNNPDDIRNQLENNNSKNNNFNFDLNYTRPISDSLKLAVGSRYNYNFIENDEITWDYDEITGQFVTQNDLFTRFTETNLNKITPYAELQLTKNKISGTLKAGTDFYNQRNFGLYRGDNYNLTVQETLPMIEANIRYKLDNNNLSFNYRYNTSLASTNQLLAIENLSNPLNIFVGNPDLDPNRAHRLSLNFSNFDRKTKQGFNVNLGYNYNESSIVNYSSVDENLITRSTYTNIEGNYNVNAGFFYSKQLSKAGNKLNLNAGVQTSYARQQAYRNSRLYTAYNSSISPNVRLTYKWNEYLTLSPSYNLRFSNSNYENYTIDQQSNTVHNFSLRTITTWPKNLTWTNEFSYNNNSRMAAGFKRDFFLWNMQMMYSFFNNKLEAGVKVYDLLNQNNSYTRTISDEYIRDERNSILTRFVMFSVTFNLNQFGGKSNNNQNFDQPRGGGMRNQRGF
ncbi:outer membrane beta-barrel protein [Faecalibacter macacae]|uniref:Outer membrane protein beta-barrel domain-containing protein n=1 Tax=Faecalibacter macacae TaxID=1859289 RepID=A0A3L9MFW0_9FLAO|nr:outer membrane beta-barrel protein [Faecalibacter macacae]RLZ11692.1 hypothetical protein EAH69_04525 [Faecalibacter macacae]